MAEQFHLIPAVADLKDLSDTLQDFYLNQCQNLVMRLQGATDANLGKIYIVVEDSMTESSVPKLRGFSSALTEKQIAEEIAKTEDNDMLTVRTYSNLLLGNAETVVALFDPIHNALASVSSVVQFAATKAKISNKKPTPDSFLEQLVAWGRSAPSDIFEDRPNEEADIYASVEKRLGPYKDMLHRKACMLEVLRVLGGYESEWNWNEGRDKNTPATKPQNEWEAGIWQVSANSIGFGKDLNALMLREIGSTEPELFQAAMKANHPLAVEYIARLLRHTIRANGPVKREEIHQWLSVGAVKEFEQLLTVV